MKLDQRAKWAAAIVLASVIVALVTMRAWWADFHGTLPADLIAFDPARPATAIASSLTGADVTSTKVEARFRANSAGRYRLVTFHSAAGADAPDRIALEAAPDDPSPADAERARLSALLSGGLDPNGQWSFGPIAISFAKDGSMDLRVDPTVSHSPNPLAHRQLVAGFRVLTSAALGLPFTVDASEMKEVFGAGYPLADLAKLDPATPVEKSAADVRTIFPGATLDSSATIAFDHPLVHRATLSWTEHRPDGTPGQLRGIDFTLAPGLAHDSGGERATLEACLEKSSGRTNAATGDAKREGAFVLALDEPEATFQMLPGQPSATMRTRDTFPPAAWASMIRALDACR